MLPCGASRVNSVAAPCGPGASGEGLRRRPVLSFASMPAPPPARPAAPRRRHAGFVLFCVAVFGVQLWLAAPDEVVASPNSYDQLRYAEMAEHLVAGDWLGPYGPFTLLRAPGYPLWLALVQRSGVPLRVAAEGLLAAAAFVFVLSLRRVGASSAVAAAAFAILVLQPHAFLVHRQVLPAGFYLPVLLLLLAGLVLAADARRPLGRAVHAAWAGLAAGLLWVTRPESFLIPGVVVGAALIELGIRRHPPLGTRLRDALLGLACVAAGAGLVIGSVAGANYRHYGLAVVAEPRSPGYLAAQRALLSVEHAAPRRFSPVPAEVRARVYAVSPSFRRLEPWLEGPSWARGVSCRQLRVCNDLGTYFAWRLREAVAARDGVRGAPATEAYFRRIAEEVQSACDAGTLRCREVRFAFLHPYWGTWLPHLGASLRALLARIGSAGTPQDRDPPRDDTSLPEPLRRRFDVLAHRRAERTSDRWFEVEGHAESPALLSAVSLRAAPDGPVTPLAVAREGGARRIDFAFRWERALAPAARPRLEIARRAGEPVEVGLEAVVRAPVQRDGVRVAVDGLEPIDAGEPVRSGVRGALWSLHALWVRVAGVGGIAAGLLCLARRRRPGRNPAYWVAVGALGLVLASRLLLLAAVDASAFPADTSRYLHPVIPLYSCLVLLLVDAALAGRRARRGQP